METSELIYLGSYILKDPVRSEGALLNANPLTSLHLILGVLEPQQSSLPDYSSFLMVGTKVVLFIFKFPVADVWKSLNKYLEN